MKINHIIVSCIFVTISSGISSLLLNLSKRGDGNARLGVGEFKEINIDSHDEVKILYEVAVLKLLEILLTTIISLKYLLACGILVLLKMSLLFRQPKPTLPASSPPPPPPQCRVQVFPETLMWDDAVSFCASLGLNIATVESQEKYDCVIQKMSESGLPRGTTYWTGGTISGPAGSRDFIWITNGQMVGIFYPGGSGQPDNGGAGGAMGVENCVAMRTDFGGALLLSSHIVNDEVCTGLNSVLCE